MPLTPALEAQTVVVLGQDWYITQQGDGYKFAYDSLPDNVSYGSPEAESDVVLAGKGYDYVKLGGGAGRTEAEFARFSKKDAEAYPKYDAALEKVANVLRDLSLQIPPNVGGGLSSMIAAAESCGYT